MIAVEAGNIEILKYLLEDNRADVNAFSEYVSDFPVRLSHLKSSCTVRMRAASGRSLY